MLLVTLTCGKCCTAGLRSAVRSAWAGLAAGFLHTLSGPDHLAVRLSVHAPVLVVHMVWYGVGSAQWQR